MKEPLLLCRRSRAQVLAASPGRNGKGPPEPGTLCELDVPVIIRPSRQQLERARAAFLPSLPVFRWGIPGSSLKTTIDCKIP